MTIAVDKPVASGPALIGVTGPPMIRIPRSPLLLLSPPLLLLQPEGSSRVAAANAAVWVRVLLLGGILEGHAGAPGRLVVVDYLLDQVLGQA